MKKILTILLLSIPSFGMSQSFEIGLLGGASNYHGDLAYNIVLGETKPSASAFVKWNVSEYWSIRPTFSLLQISGHDSNFSEYALRNLSFRNTIMEFSTNVELNFKEFSARSIHQRGTFYAFIAPGVMHHKPEAQLNGEWYELRPLQTEGATETARYRQIQIVVPFGVGYKQMLTDNLILGMELGWRRLFTDYLDDVSGTYVSQNDLNSQLARDLSDRSWQVSENGQTLANPGDMRGDSKLNDWYMQAGITLSYRFTPIKCPF